MITGPWPATCDSTICIRQNLTLITRLKAPGQYEYKSKIITRTTITISADYDIRGPQVPCSLCELWVNTPEVIQGDISLFIIN